VVRDVPSTAAVTAALAATTLGHQLVVAADEDTSRVPVRFSVLVPPPFVPQIKWMLARGPFRPRAIWSIVEHIVACPSLLAVCGPIVDWCCVAVAMWVGADIPLQAIDGYPMAVAHDEVLGSARMAVRGLDFLPVLAPGIAVSALQPLVLWMPWWRLQTPAANARRPRKTSGMPRRKKRLPRPPFGSRASARCGECAKPPTQGASPHLGPVGQSRHQACPSRLGRGG
jgi:hypothetical protein